MTEEKNKRKEEVEELRKEKRVVEGRDEEVRK
jgi:hypothetical protein